MGHKFTAEECVRGGKARAAQRRETFVPWTKRRRKSAEEIKAEVAAKLRESKW